MGNRIAIERRPVPLAAVLKGNGTNGHRAEGSDANDDEVGGGGGGRKAGSYNSSLHVWRFFTSEDDPQAVHNEAVCLNESFSSFDKNQVYLALHIYSENVAASRPIKIANGGLNSSTSEPATLGGGGGGESSRATIESLLASSVEAFTPRGLAACLEEAFITSTSSSADLEGGCSTSQDDDNGEVGDAVTGNSSTGAEEGETQPLAYSLYVWRGKDSTRYAQALALTKSFELEKALKKDGKKALRQLFGAEDKVPLSSMFTTNNNLLLRLPNAASTSTPGESDDGARRHCTHRHAEDEGYDDVDSEDEGDADGGSEEDEERPYSRQHHLYHQLLKRRRLTRKSAAGGEAGENPCTDSGCNGSVPKLSLPRVKDLFQAPPPTSPSGHGRGRSLSADSLDAIIHTAIQDLDSPQPTSTVGSGITDGVALLTVDSSTSSSSSSSSGKTTRSITKSTSLTIPSPSVAPPSPKKLLGKGKLKLPPIKTEGMSKSGPIQAIPISGFNLQDLQALQEKEQSSDSDTFTKAEANQRQDKLTKYDSICSKITDQLYLGSQTVSQDKAMLKQQGVTHILNCAGSICPIYHPNDFTYRTLYLLDGVREDITCMLYDIIEWMDNVITSNGKILVHCQQGVSRSSAMMIGYLMWKHGWGFERTHMFVKERRGVSSPNTGFICQLLELAKRLSLARGGADRGTRLYQVVTHTRHDPDFVVAKLARKENLTELEESSAPSPSCYILQSPEEFFIWVGAQCNERFVEVAERTVRRVQHFENASKVVHTVEQGKETEEFKRRLGQLNLDELT